MTAGHLKFVVRMAALLCLAAVVLCGFTLWQYAHGVPWHPVIGGIDSGVLDPLTAASILLGALGTLIAMRRRIRKFGHVVSILAGVGAVIRIVDLVRGTTTVDKIAALTFHAIHSTETLQPAMPAGAAVAILLCALAAALRLARRASAAQVAAAVALAPALASGGGYLLAVDIVFGRLPVLTLAAILLWGLSILAATGHRGALRAILSRSLPGHFARHQLLIATLSPLGFAALFARLLPAGQQPFAIPETVVATVVVAWISIGVTAVVGRRLDIARHRAEADLRAMARRDSLTGLLNRRSMDVSLDHRFAQARQNARPISFLMCDLDHFKKLNDEHGHATGDLVLKRTAGRISAAVRDSDQVFRYGGEEIAVLLDDCGPADAMRIAEKIRESVKAPARRSADPVLPTTTISIGAATSERGESELGQILARADDSLYQAKEGGRDQVQQVVLP